jgi:hypothetical protein
LNVSCGLIGVAFLHGQTENGVLIVSRLVLPHGSRIHHISEFAPARGEGIVEIVDLGPATLPEHLHRGGTHDE